MIVIDIETAGPRLDSLIDRALAGEEVVLTRGSVAVAKLVAVERVPRQRRFGVLKGELHVPDEFVDPLSHDELALWKQ